jgi:Ni/Fe-hydrogenase subunit HybB-like protein
MARLLRDQSVGIPTEREAGTPGFLVDVISSPIFRNTPVWWWVGFTISASVLGLFIFTIINLLVLGTGIWGINIPVIWGVGIVNFIFWIGIGHAGTFISAVLLLMRQHWRSTFSRFAEAATLIALVCAGLFPLLHLGRPQYAYWLFPYPNILELNPNWRSALAWDAVAVSVYGLVSLMFWYIDLLPDLAAMRDKAENRYVKMFYAILSTGWRGDSAHWERLHNSAYMFAAIATPLVISVHSIVGLDFAIALTPGWHHTIFPPYFVAGAVFSGFAAVIIIAVGLRRAFNWQEVITIDHLENAAKFVLVTGLMVTYGYSIEWFGAWYLNHEMEWILTIQRAFGQPYLLFYWSMIFFNVIAIQALWFKRVRRNIPLLVTICVGVLIGMWLERFVIVTISLSYSYLPSGQEYFQPTIWDWLTTLGPFGLFATLLLLFIRILPSIPMYEAELLASEEH